MISILQDIILEEINDSKINHESIIISYAFCLKISNQGESIDWNLINQSIISRFDKSTLEMIKLKSNTIQTYWEKTKNFPYIPNHLF